MKLNDCLTCVTYLQFDHLSLGIRIFVERAIAGYFQEAHSGDR